MVKKQYDIEREGQIDFFDAFGIPYTDDDSILIDNTDGIFNGNILEFKRNINNLNAVLLQAIKYCSRLRIKGKSVPATILLVDLNETTVYVYYSEDYRDEIQTIYIGGASKDNAGFTARAAVAKYDYSDMADTSAVRKILKGKKAIKDMYMPVDIDENCIVGWATRYYRELPHASKGDFLGDDTGVSVRVIGEIRDPKQFKDLIRPYTGKTNEKFKYLMDCLNDRLSRKDLGAFYTPEIYAKKAAELVKMATDKVPDGNDYIILDRCAGTGNLEAALIGVRDANGDELISHCVVSTYEYYEYKVLQERIGDKVREIIPPTEATVAYENGKVANADAMSEDYINNPIIKNYVDDDKCTVILFENPPYRDKSAANKTKDGNSLTTQSHVFVQMSLHKNSFKNNNISTVRDLTNQFIWSGVNYYMRQDTDSYVLFAPVKWWKDCGVADLTYIKGFLFDRKFFHASSGAILCALWENKNDKLTDEIYATAIPDVHGESEEFEVSIRKCHKTFTAYYEKHVRGIETNVFCESNGYEAHRCTCSGKSIFSEDIIAYATPKGFTFDANNNSLVRMTHYNNRGTYVCKHNYKIMLPLFVAKEYPKNEFYEKGECGIYYTTSDGGDAYTKDRDFLKSCLIYTCLSKQNKCLTFDGSDGRHYQNELCFDEGTVATRDIQKYHLDDAEQELMDLWGKILEEAKDIAATKGYDPNDTLGVYQITKELNTFKKVKTGKRTDNVYDYPVLNGDLETLRIKLKEYYQTHIRDKMFRYELVK